ncbi:MAG: hypothetical protein AB8B83_02885 [Bdellovibrionales bacterium]
MGKITPEHVSNLSLSDLDRLLKDLQNGQAYTRSESHALKQTLILISHKDLLDKSSRELWENHINQSMTVQRIDKAIDEIWMSLGKPNMPNPAVPQLNQ